MEQGSSGGRLRRLHFKPTSPSDSDSGGPQTTVENSSLEATAVYPSDTQDKMKMRSGFSTSCENISSVYSAGFFQEGGISSWPLGDSPHAYRPVAMSNRTAEDAALTLSLEREVFASAQYELCLQCAHVP